jgi:hypothetical protein
MNEIFQIVYDRSWKLRRRSWLTKGEKDGLYYSKAGGKIYI